MAFVFFSLFLGILVFRALSVSGLTCLLNDQYFYAGEHSVLFHSSQVVLVLLSEFEVHLVCVFTSSGRETVWQGAEM